LISSKGLPECQPVAKIAKFALKNHFPASVATAAGLRAVGYTRAWQATLHKLRDHTSTLADFFKRLDGYRHLRVDRTAQTARFLYDGGALVSAVWITRRALSAFLRAKYIELDCSWRGLAPFAYCIPLAIVNNEAIPLGLIITPTEAKLTYEWFFHDLEAYAGIRLPDKCVLSDEGEAIIAFVRDRGWPHFFCWWHLIHKFRGCRILQIMVIRILRFPEERDFLLELETVKMQLTLLVDAEYVSLADAKTFAVFLGYSAYPIRDDEECHYQHGVWFRHEIEDCATTGHNERIHRTTEGKTEGVVTLPERLSRAEEVITAKCKQFTDGVHQQRQRLIKKMVAQKADQTSVCQCDSCRRRTQLLSRRYGVPCPCKHTAKDFAFPPDNPAARALPASLPTEPAVHVSDAAPWPPAKRPRPESLSLDAFVNRADPNRPALDPDSENYDDAFLIRVMREAAKIHRHKNKQQLMFDIDANYWEDHWEACRGDAHFRAQFWFSWVATFRRLEPG
jgi:hypothetical protein